MALLCEHVLWACPQHYYLRSLVLRQSAPAHPAIRPLCVPDVSGQKSTPVPRRQHSEVSQIRCPLSLLLRGSRRGRERSSAISGACRREDPGRIRPSFGDDWPDSGAGRSTLQACIVGSDAAIGRTVVHLDGRGGGRREEICQPLRPPDRWCQQHRRSPAWRRRPGEEHDIVGRQNDPGTGSSTLTLGRRKVQGR